MADTATEIDLDSVIDRLLEGELSSIRTSTRPTVLSCLLTACAAHSSTRKPSWKACAAPRVRDQVPVHQG